MKVDNLNGGARSDSTPEVRSLASLPDSEYDTFDGDYEELSLDTPFRDQPVDGITARDFATALEVQDELARQERINAGLEDACRMCGCSATRACEGGCIWVEPDLCSRCYRAINAMAKAWSAGGEA